MKHPPSSVFRFPSSVPAKRAPSVFRFPSSVLIAVTGMSPAILTETAWALANEKPRLLPGKVIVFATTRSREQIRSELLAGGVWENLRRALKAKPDELVFGDAGDHIRVFSRQGRELDDLRTPEDNQAAADFMLEHLRQFTENPDLRIVASIAGGRKTMGALLYAAMTLIGRETDRITHVLLDERLEQQRDPKFYYPQNKREGRGVNLADIPFVPLRNKFQDLGRMPGSFSRMVAQYSRLIKAEKDDPVKIGFAPSGVFVNGTFVKLSARLLNTLAFLLHVNETPPVPQQKESLDRYRDFLKRRGAGPAQNNDDLASDLRKDLNQLRRKFAECGLDWMPGLGRESLRLPPFQTEDGKQEDGKV